MATHSYERLYHEDWQDDQTMDVLFSPFRENRQVNPHSWDKKMTFWTELIISHCQGTKCLVVNAATLPQQFKRGEKLPVCLNDVLREMLYKGKLKQLSDFQQGISNGWVTWSFNVLVKKPLSWSFSTLVKRPMSWGLGQLTGQTQKQECLGDLVVLNLVKEKAEEILTRHYASAQHSLTDNIVSYTQLWRQCHDIVSDEQSFQVALMWLCKQKKCCLTTTENQEKVVQFASKNDIAPAKMSECDLQIFRLKKAEAATETQVEELTSQMENCRLEAKEYLQKGLKTSAKNALKRKKKIESLRDGKETALENIRHMLRIIQQVETDKMVLDAYASGSEAFKEITRRYGLTPDMIDNVMTDVNETLDLNEELHESISQNPMDVGEPSMDELEAELEMILAGGEKTVAPPRKAVTPPRRTVTPSDVMRVPHQELVNSLCQMKVLDRSVCPKNTYKDTTGDQPCDNCPPNHVTATTASVEKHQCQCLNTTDETTICIDECELDDRCPDNHLCKYTVDGDTECVCLAVWSRTDCRTNDDDFVENDWFYSYTSTGYYADGTAQITPPSSANNGNIGFA